MGYYPLWHSLEDQWACIPYDTIWLKIVGLAFATGICVCLIVCVYFIGCHIVFSRDSIGVFLIDCIIVLKALSFNVMYLDTLLPISGNADIFI
jgi:hypothetical protein